MYLNTEREREMGEGGWSDGNREGWRDSGRKGETGKDRRVPGSGVLGFGVVAAFGQMLVGGADFAGPYLAVLPTCSVCVCVCVCVRVCVCVCV